MRSSQLNGPDPRLHWELVCSRCRREYPADHTDYCSDCGSPVISETRTVSDAPLAGSQPGIWRYAAHLPIDPGLEWLSLGEGGTPIVLARNAAERAGVKEVWLLLDHLNPTGSFKDRAAAAGVAAAVSAGAVGVVCASSGNAAASAAAYAARAGLPAIVVVPELVPAGKLASILAYGAVAMRVPGNYSQSFSLARQLAEHLGMHNLATTYINPTAIAALRTVAFDIYEHFQQRQLDRVLVPTGSGPLVHGVVSGFEYLRRSGRNVSIPKVDAVQMSGCAPIVKADSSGTDEVRAWGEVTTSISGLNDPLEGYPGDGSQTLRAVRSTGGCTVAVTDEQALAAQSQIAKEEGAFVEAGSATVVAALETMSTRGYLASDDVVLCLLTGNGLKTLHHDASDVPVVHDLQEAITYVSRAAASMEVQGAS